MPHNGAKSTPDTTVCGELPLLHPISSVYGPTDFAEPRETSRNVGISSFTKYRSTSVELYLLRPRAVGNTPLSITDVWRCTPGDVLFRVQATVKTLTSISTMNTVSQLGSCDGHFDTALFALHSNCTIQKTPLPPESSSGRRDRVCLISLPCLPS